MTNLDTTKLDQLFDWYCRRKDMPAALESKILAQFQAPVYSALSVAHGINAAIMAATDGENTIYTAKEWDKVLASQGLQFILHGSNGWQIYRDIEGFVDGVGYCHKPDVNAIGWRTHDIRMRTKVWINDKLREYREAVLNFYLPDDIWGLLHDSNDWYKLIDYIGNDSFDQIYAYPTAIRVGTVFQFALDIELIFNLIGYDMSPRAKDKS